MNLSQLINEAHAEDLVRSGLPTPFFNLAIQGAGDKRVAYVSQIDNPETTVTVSARDEAALVCLLWERYALAPTTKSGIFKSASIVKPKR